MPKLIALEGIDGSGKTTVAKILSNKFNYTHLDLTHSSFRPFMDNLLGCADSNMFHAANIVNLMHTSSLVKAEIALGNNVVCDRYIPTIVGYHRTMAKRKGVTNIFDPSLECCNIAQPDFMFHLTVNEEIRQQRMNARGKTTNADRMMDNTEIRSSILAEYQAMDMIEIDTSLLTPQEVLAKIQTYLA